MFKEATPQTVIYDALKFSLWTGNFKITYPGTHQMGSRATLRFVRLFPGSDNGLTPKHVMSQPQSRIEFLEARVPMAWSEDEKSITLGVNRDMWLKVRIDGFEGWIHSEEDFEAVGLAQDGLRSPISEGLAANHTRQYSERQIDWRNKRNRGILLGRHVY